MPKGLNKDTINLKVNLDMAKAASDWSAFSKNVYSLYNQVNTNPLQFDLDPKQIRETSKALADLQTHMVMATNQRTGNLDFSKLSTSLKDANVDLTKYGESLLKLGPQGQEAFSQLTRSVAQSEIPVRRLSSMMGEFGTVMKNTIRWQLSSSLIHGFMGSVQQAFNYAQNLNRSLNDIRIVTGQSNEQMAQFAETANKAARALSSTTVSYTDAALIYYQQGIRDQKEIEARTNATIKMANVTGQSAAKVSDQMTAIWNNFAEGSTNLEYYADVITALGAATASSSEEISKGLEKFAAIADTVGLSYENATAALATITATTRQSADSVGTGLRTLFSRLQSVTLGKTLEDGVNLTKYSKALETVGVSVLNTNGELRTMDEIVEDLGQRWNKIGDAQKVALAQTVGGVRQYTTLMALMDNFDFYKQNQEVANSAEGTLEQQQKIYEESWAASSKRVRAAAEEVYGALIDDKFFIKLNDAFASSLGTIGDLIKGLGGVRGALFSIGSVASLVFKDQIANRIGSIPTFFTNLFTPADVFKERRRQTLEDLIATSRNANISDDNWVRQRNLLVGQAESNQWLMENKQNMSPADLFRYQQTQAIADANISRYNNLLIQEADIRDQRGNVSENVYLSAYNKRVPSQAEINDANRIVKTYGGQRISSGRIKYDQDGLRDENSADRIALLRYREMGLLSNKDEVVDLRSSFNSEFKNSLDNFNKSIKQNYDFFNNDKVAERITQAFSSTDKYSKQIQETMKANLQKRGVSQELINSLTKGEISLKDVGNTLVADQYRNLINQGWTEKDINLYKQFYEEELKAGRDATQADKNAQENLKDLRAQQALDAGVEKRMTATASAFMSLGMAISQTNGVMNQWDQVAKTGEGTGQALLSTMTALPMSFMMLSSSLKNVGQSFGETSKIAKLFSGGSLAAVTLGIQAAVAVGTYAVKKIKENTTEADLERLEEQTQKTEQRADSARQAYDTLLNQKSNYSESLKALDKLREGTNEYRKALLDANKAADELISTNDLAYGKDWTYNNQGIKEITQEALDQTTEASIKRAEDAQQIADYSKALLSIAQTSLNNISYSESNGLSVDEKWQDKAVRFFAPSVWEQAWFSDYLKARKDNEGLTFKEYGEQRANIYSMDDTFLGDRSFMSNNSILSNFEKRYAEILNIVNKAGYETIEQYAKDLIEGKDSRAFNESLISLIDSYALENDGNISLVEELARDSILARNEIRSYKELEEQGLDEFIAAQKIDQNLANYNLKNLKATKNGDSLANLYKYVFGQAPDESFRTGNGASWDAEQLYNEIISYYGNQALLEQFNKEVENKSNLKDIEKYENYNLLTSKNIQKLIETYQDNTDYKELNQQLIKIQRKQIENFTIAFANTGLDISDSNINERIGKLFENNNYSFDELSGIANLLNQYTSRFGEQVSQVIGENLLNNNNFYDFIKDVEIGDNTLQTIVNIRKEAKRQNRNVDNLIQEIKESTGSGNLLQNLYDADSFQEALSSIRDELENTGNVGADSIAKIAEKTDGLKELLKDSKINAAGVADALEAVELGTIRLGQVSTALLESLSLAGNVEGGMAETFAYIDNFDEARSGMDIGKFYKQRANAIQSAWTTGNWFDPALLQNWEVLFGKDELERYRETIIKASRENRTPEEIDDIMNEAFEAQIEAAKSIQKNGNLDGLWKYYTKRDGTTDNQFSYRDNRGRNQLLYTINDHGQIQFVDEDILTQQGIKTRDDLLEVLKSAGWDEHLAASMIDEQLMRDPAMADYFGRNGATESLEKLLGINEDNTYDRFVTTEQLKALYESHPEYFNGQNGITNWNSFLKWVNTQYENNSNGKKIIDFLPNVGDTIENIQNQLQKNGLSSDINQILTWANGGQLINSFGTSINDIAQRGAIDNVVNGFLGLGYQSSDAWRLANDYIQQQGGEDWLKEVFGISRFDNGNKEENTQYDRFIKFLDGFGKTIDEATAQDVYKFQEQEAAFTQDQWQDKLLTVLDSLDKHITEEPNEGKGSQEGENEGQEGEDGGGTQGTGKTSSNEQKGTLFDNNSTSNAFGQKSISSDKIIQSVRDDVLNIEARDQIALQDSYDKIVDEAIKNGLEIITNPSIVDGVFKTFKFDNITIGVRGEWSQFSSGLEEQINNFGEQWNAAAAKLHPPMTGENGGYQGWNGSSDPWWKAMADYLLNGGEQDTIPNKSGTRTTSKKASGYNNIGYFASGKKSNGGIGYEGIAETGELGPELWIHDGKPYLTGLHGRTKVYIHPDDQIWTAAQTREILRDNPSLQDIPGFDVGGGNHRFNWGKKSGGGSAGGGGEEDEYEPERYHVITRQLAQLTQQYEELSKVKENAYGTNKLDSIQREIDMTNTLIEGQRELIKQAEEYAREDRQKIVDLELDTKLEFDENGNITNWEDVETELGKKAKNGDKTAAENLQKLKQYEESVDKWNEAQQQLRDYIYQLSDLTLEKITTKVELIVDMDDREINFIDHFIDKLDDKVGDVAEILTLTGQKLEKINDQIEVTRNGLNDVIKLMRNDYGEALSEDQVTLLQNVIDNVGGQYSTAQEIFDALDPLHINESFGRQIESYVDDLLKYIEAMDKLKKEGIDKLDKAFDELNKNISDSMNLFSYYNDVLSKMKDITELQGTTLTKELRDLTRSLNQSILDNSLNNLKAERQNQARLQEAVRELQQQVENETDDSLRRAWEDELKKAEKELQDSTKSVLSLIQDSLEQAKTMFENALDGITEDYEKQISGMYGTTEELSNAFDRKKEIDDFYVDDYEKYYQIAKLQRSITGDIDKAARAGNKSNQGLKKLLNELNAAREDGVELTAYDLDVFAKRYEYEKALMELEDARNDKSEVRLQRDANGNWGYVYTSAADEDDLLAKQQAVDDKLYEWQKTVDNQADEVQSTILNTFSDIVSKANEMLKNGESQDAVQDYINDRIKALQLYSEQFGTSLSDALQTLDIAKDRYGKESFDMLDNYGESILSSILGVPLEAIPKFITDALKTSFSEADKYSELIKSIDTEGGYKDFISGITGTRKEIDALSDQNRIETISAIGDATTQFTDIMNEAISYEDKFLAIYGIQIEQTERELGRLLDILDAVNRIEYDDGEGYKNKDSLDMSDITKTEKPSNGAGGYCDGCINTCEGGLNSTAGCHWSCQGKCGGNCGNSCGGNCGGNCGNNCGNSCVDSAASSNEMRKEKIAMRKGGFDTGGYTGSWGKEGKLAVLHEKEQVFNKDDTEKLLNAASILRTIDLQADIFGKGLTGISIPQLLGQTGQTTLDQNVHIDATFPNVTDHNEIEMAFDNLVNKASQYANRKNMSSMTFQDMYTSKF